jgi:hypothetical protein
MIAQDLAYEGFASPHTGVNNGPLLETLVVGHGRHVVEQFLERNISRLNQQGKGLAPALAAWLQCEPAYDAVCNFSFGDMHASLLLDEPGEEDRCATALAIHLHAFGLEGEWHHQLVKPSNFFFDRWMLPPCDAVKVSAAVDRVLIDTRTTDGWKQTTFQRGMSGWDSDTAQGVMLMNRSGLRCRVLPAEYLPSASPARMLAKGLYDGDSRDTDTSIVVKTGVAAVDLLSQFAGVYLPWVEEVIKDLIPLPPRPGILHSASGKLAPGIISVTNQHLSCALAEQLVHEATHQHLYQLGKLGPMDDGTDMELYFSPFRNMGRPIFYILFAYHAFANVLLYYRTALANGMSEDEPGITDQKKLKADLLICEKALETTHALTPLGCAIWEPLREMVHRS